VPDCFWIESNTAGVPFTFAVVTGSAAPSSTRATFPILTGWPLRVASPTFASSWGDVMRLSALRVSCVLPWSTVPAGSWTFWFCTACNTDVTGSP